LFTLSFDTQLYINHSIVVTVGTARFFSLTARLEAAILQQANLSVVSFSLYQHRDTPTPMAMCGVLGSPPGKSSGQQLLGGRGLRQWWSSIQ